MALVIALGCAGRDDTADETSNAASAGESGSEGDTVADVDGTSATDASASASAEGTETSGQSACDPSDTEIGPAVTIAIANETASTIYLVEALQCVFVRPFGIVRDGEELRIRFEDCDTCRLITTGQCGCDASCVDPTLIRLDPGGRWEGDWAGSYATAIDLSDECAHEDCAPSCSVVHQAEPGTYLARVVATAEAACESPPCDCPNDPNRAGWCPLGGSQSGPEIVAEASFEYPDETSVSVVFR